MRLAFIVTALALTSFHSFATETHVDVVYGEDGRSEPYQRPGFNREASAVAAMVDKTELRNQTADGFNINVPTHAQAYGLCQGERFNNQPILATCTGFLVAPDIIMTAGHCVTNSSDCSSNVWVFGYEMTPAGIPRPLEKKNVYQCKQIIATSQGNNRLDFAIIKLDRVTDRQPLRLLGKNLSAKVGDKLVMMGYPSGLPLKIAEGASVLKANSEMLVTNLDAFHVNSGSPVFDAVSGLVVGILVAGEPDYKPSSRSCSVVNNLPETSGAEKVTNMGAIMRNF